MSSSRKNGLPVRALDDVPAQQRQRRVGTKMIAQDRLRLRGPKRSHVDLPVMRPLHQRRAQSGPEIDQQHRRGSDHGVGKGLDELLARRIDPVQIVDQDDRHIVTRCGAYQFADEIEQLGLAGLGIQFRRGLARVRQTEEFQQHGCQMIGDRHCRQPVEDTAARNVRRFLLDAKPENIPKQRQHRLKRRCAAVREHTRLEDADALAATTLGKFEAKATLSNAGFANDTDHPAISLAGVLEFSCQRRKLVGAAGQGTQPSSGPEHTARRRMLKAPQPEHLDGSREPPNGLLSKRLHLHELLRDSVGFPRDQNGAGLGKVLQSTGEVHVRARGIIGLIDAVLDGLEDDLTGVDADADLHIDVMQALDVILHRQRRETAPNGVILMRLRGAEHRHDAVALGLVDDAAVAVNRLVHQVEHRLQAPHAQFGISEAIDDARRVADISEKDREALPLPALGMQAPQRMLVRRLNPGRVNRRRQRSAALSAKAAA
ncbi:hypothetical protein ACVI1L_000218 [Bradyrhizobium sp. USDA 4516]